MGRTGSTLILLVVALGLGGYLYFVESERPVADENAKKKVFTYDAAKINQLQIKSSSGEVTALRKGANDTWTIVQPVEAPADRNSVSDVVTNLANLEEQRVVDENAADLKAYGLAEPRVDVTFHVDGEKEPKRILLGDKTPASSGTYAKLPSSNRVFLVDSALETAARQIDVRLPRQGGARVRPGQSDVAGARVWRPDDSPGEERRRLEAGQADSGARGFRQRQRPHRTAAVGADDGAEGSPGRSQGSETVRPRQTGRGRDARHGRVVGEVRARQRSGCRIGLGDAIRRRPRSSASTTASRWS